MNNKKEPLDFSDLDNLNDLANGEWQSSLPSGHERDAIFEIARQVQAVKDRLQGKAVR